MHIVVANMHCQAIACTKSIGTGLTLTESQKLEYLKRTALMFFLIRKLLNLICNRDMPLFHLTKGLSMIALLSLLWLE
jgi:hypothetical protein